MAYPADARWRERARSWCPYVVPYVAFALVVEIQDALPYSLAYRLYPLRVVLPLACLLFYLTRGDFPELSGFRPAAAGLTLDVLVGLGISALWSVPYVLGALPKPSVGFDPNALGEPGRLLLLSLRLVGFTLVTPFIEELFVRSFLLRLTDAWERDGDFRNVPMARFTWRSFLVTVAVFTVSHARWQWPVAAVTGITFNLWLYKRQHLGAVIVTHAVSNASLFVAAVVAGAYSPPGAGHSLWFLL